MEALGCRGEMCGGRDAARPGVQTGEAYRPLAMSKSPHTVLQKEVSVCFSFRNLHLGPLHPRTFKALGPIYFGFFIKWADIP